MLQMLPQDIFNLESDYTGGLCVFGYRTRNYHETSRGLLPLVLMIGRYLYSNEVVLDSLEDSCHVCTVQVDPANHMTSCS